MQLLQTRRPRKTAWLEPSAACQTSCCRLRHLGSRVPQITSTNASGAGPESTEGAHKPSGNLVCNHGTKHLPPIFSWPVQLVQICKDETHTLGVAPCSGKPSTLLFGIRSAPMQSPLQKHTLSNLRSPKLCTLQASTAWVPHSVLHP